MVSGPMIGSNAKYFGGLEAMRQRTHIFCFAMLLFAGILPGCLVIEVGVSNPAPNLPRIAIAPFINLSTERAVDGRRFAEAYQTELQKIPGFQVIPVGVVESAMHDHQLNLDSPEDLTKLAQILDVDGICLGAVTEYTPYYPPRLGLQISWYTPGLADFQPGIPVLPVEKPPKGMRGKASQWSNSVRSMIPGFSCNSCGEFTAIDRNSIDVVRAQNEASPVPAPPYELKPDEQDGWDQALREALKIEDGKSRKKTGRPELGPFPKRVQPALPEETTPGGPLNLPQLPAPGNSEEQPNRQNDNIPQAFPELPQVPQDSFSNPMTPSGASPSQPYMSYTRIFDGADAKFTASLRNYLELGGDQRSGGWTGHLHRSEDFIRFCMHRVILEMLQLHGGETKRRFVLTSRKYR